MKTPSRPCMVATWHFGQEACAVGIARLISGSSALDAVEAAANAVEENPAVTSVGYGGLPNADGVVELDAAIMDGPEHRAGAVAALTTVVRATSVARKVMELTPHVMLVGQNATRFALSHGFPAAELLTPEAKRRWLEWKTTKSAPTVAHFSPSPLEGEGRVRGPEQSHDTIGIVALDASGNLAAVCTTSGLAFKLPGRVGDSPLIGSGLYVDNAVGAASATGNGDEMMKVCLSYRVVSLMERGAHPQEACEEAIRYLLRKRPGAQSQGAACIALAKSGAIGSAATRDGFRAPGRKWQYAFTEGERVELKEGVYVE